jgi:hypothetical protein
MNKKNNISKGLRASHLIKKGHLALTHPDQATFWHPILNGDLTPKDVFHSSTLKVWWLGDCGHSWNSQVRYKVTGKGCPYCAGQKLLPGFNDLQTKNPILAKEWNYDRNELHPNQVFPGSCLRVWWKCGHCSHQWKASLNNRNKNRGCPLCATVYHRSKGEQELIAFVRTIYSGPIIENDRKVLGGREIDILLPRLSVGIEFNCDYWHGHNLILSRTGKSAMDYHLDKVRRACQSGILLAFVWQSDWDSHPFLIRKALVTLINDHQLTPCLEKLEGSLYQEAVTTTARSMNHDSLKHC